MSVVMLFCMYFFVFSQILRSFECFSTSLRNEPTNVSQCGSNRTIHSHHMHEASAVCALQFTIAKCRSQLRSHHHGLAARKKYGGSATEARTTVEGAQSVVVKSQ